MLRALKGPYPALLVLLIDNLIPIEQERHIGSWRYVDAILVDLVILDGPLVIVAVGDGVSIPGQDRGAIGRWCKGNTTR